MRARKAAVREQKKHEQESAQPQVGSSISAAFLRASTRSGCSSPPPAMHTAGPSPPQKRPQGVPSIAWGDACAAGVSSTGCCGKDDLS
ncbi:UNVERIFIED_CONTAM: hypothetical protein Sradi_0729100 [Sesamum radiatum]|uniref:Uncharacterized protein n=1 Tax=Sesamum radiatum TaxID=300843 RepID=A0AAW2VPI7_SESRA